MAGSRGLGSGKATRAGVWPSLQADSRASDRCRSPRYRGGLCHNTPIWLDEIRHVRRQKHWIGYLRGFPVQKKKIAGAIARFGVGINLGSFNIIYSH